MSFPWLWLYQGWSWYCFYKFL